MKVCGINIKKRRIHLSLVQHFTDTNQNAIPRFKLLKTQILYIPKHFEKNPLDVSYKFNGNKLIQEADFCQVVYDARKDIKSQSIAIKEITYLILIDFLKTTNKPFYSEPSRTLKYRMGHRAFIRIDNIVKWLEQNLINFDKIALMGRNGIDTQKVLSVVAGCSTKKTKGR